MTTDWDGDPLLARLSEGKRQLREARRTMSLPEKVRQVVELQKIHIATVRKRRALHELEVVWQLDDPE